MIEVPQSSVLASIVRHRNRLQFPDMALREEVRIKKHLFAILLGIAAALFTPYATSADLIFLGRVAGSRLVGTVSTILRIQHPGNTTTESASVSRSGGADVKSDTGITSGGRTNVGNVKTGASQTLTQTLGGNGITKASHSAVVFNADEPRGNSLTRTGLQMGVFNGNTDIFDAHLAASMALATAFTGIGTQGFVRLDSPQAAALQLLPNPLAPANVETLRIGLSASASDATGGPETFNLATITPVPEPGTLVFVGTALAGLGVWGRKRLLNAFAA